MARRVAGARPTPDRPGPRRVATACTRPSRLAGHGGASPSAHRRRHGPPPATDRAHRRGRDGGDPSSRPCRFAGPLPLRARQPIPGHRCRRRLPRPGRCRKSGRRARRHAGNAPHERRGGCRPQHRPDTRHHRPRRLRGQRLPAQPRLDRPAGRSFRRPDGRRRRTPRHPACTAHLGRPVHPGSQQPRLRRPTRARSSEHPGVLCAHRCAGRPPQRPAHRGAPWRCLRPDHVHRRGHRPGMAAARRRLAHPLRPGRSHRTSRTAYLARAAGPATALRHVGRAAGGTPPAQPHPPRAASLAGADRRRIAGPPPSARWRRVRRLPCRHEPHAAGQRPPHRRRATDDGRRRRADLARYRALRDAVRHPCAGCPHGAWRPQPLGPPHRRRLAAARTPARRLGQAPPCAGSHPVHRCRPGRRHRLRRRRLGRMPCPPHHYPAAPRRHLAPAAHRLSGKREPS